MMSEFVARALAEDLGSEGDITTRLAIHPGAEGMFIVRARESGVLCGVSVASEVARQTGVRFVARVEDGGHFVSETIIGTLEGSVRSILAAERTLLNVVGMLSGTATATAACVLEVSHTRARICATRKTVAGMRVLQKWAVECGGGDPHRMGLFDAVLLKDNHLAGIAVDELAASVARIAVQARMQSPKPTFVCCEVDDLAQFDSLVALPDGTLDIILLDNFSLDAMRSSVVRRDQRGSTVLLEASGGMRSGSLRAVAETGVDRISVGALTHSVRWIDFGLDAS